MILYFSGTGNSEYAAKRLGKQINDEVVDLFVKIRSRDFSQIQSDKPWVIVTPTYAWRIPRILQEWLENTILTGSKDMYFVMTCGGSTGNAGSYLERLCHAKGMKYQGCNQILMPENYITMFSAPTPEKALEIIERAESEIDQTALFIKNQNAFPQHAVTCRDRVESGFVNAVFYPLFVHAAKFYVTDSCISCGKCVNVCPLRNIRLKAGRPEWGKSCTQCMACIGRCPKEAIEYGRHTKGKRRYTFPVNR